MTAHWTARLETWLSDHRASYLALLARPATDAALAEAKIPEPLARLYRWHDGQSDGGGASLVGRLWFMPLADLLFQRKENADTARDLKLVGWWESTWYPFLDDGEGNLVCFDAKTETLIFYEHDNETRSKLAPSLDDFFGVLVSALEEGIFEADEDGVWPKKDRAATWERMVEQAGVYFPSL